jgi:hypothetical protein
MIEEGVVAVVDGAELRGKTGFLDITGADENIEIEIRGDGKVLWVNMGRCVFRVCCIRGGVEVIDHRPETAAVGAIVQRRSERT